MPQWNDGDEALFPAWVQAQEVLDARGKTSCLPGPDGPLTMVAELLWERRSPRVRQVYRFGCRYTLYGPPLWGEPRCQPYGKQCMAYPRLVRALLDPVQAAFDAVMAPWWLVFDAMEGTALATTFWIGVYATRRGRTKPPGRLGWWWVPEHARLARKRPRRRAQETV